MALRRVQSEWRAADPRVEVRPGARGGPTFRSFIQVNLYPRERR